MSSARSRSGTRRHCDHYPRIAIAYARGMPSTPSCSSCSCRSNTRQELLVQVPWAKRLTLPTPSGSAGLTFTVSRLWVDCTWVNTFTCSGYGCAHASQGASPPARHLPAGLLCSEHASSTSKHPAVARGAAAVTQSVLATQVPILAPGAHAGLPFSLQTPSCSRALNSSCVQRGFLAWAGHAPASVRL